MTDTKIAWKPTDTKITWTTLTAAATEAGITLDQACTILEAIGVEVHLHPAPGWYLTEDGEVARLKLNKHTGAPILYIDGDVLLPHQTWPKLTPARVVPTTTAAPVTLTEDQAGAEWDKGATGADTSLWLELPVSSRKGLTRFANAILAQHAAPAEGEQIDPCDVRKGDRVRLVMKNGDEATFTVRRVDESWVDSGHNAYRKRDIRTIHLLHRERAEA